MFNDRPGAFWPDAAATRPDHLPTVMPAQRHLAVTRRGPPPSRAFMFFFAVLSGHAGAWMPGKSGDNSENTGSR